MRVFKISSHASYTSKYELRCADLGLRSQVQSGDRLCGEPQTRGDVRGDAVARWLIARGASIVGLGAARAGQAAERTTGVPVGIAILRPGIRAPIASEDTLTASSDASCRP
jgi:hypothetical protein